MNTQGLEYGQVLFARVRTPKLFCSAQVKRYRLKLVS